MAEPTIQPATETDLVGLTDIYNHYVITSPVTFDLEPFSVDGRREWFSHYGESGPHRLLVAREEDRILGYATSSRFRPKGAYDTSVETTVYCHPEHGGRGVGTLLYSALFETLEKEDVHRAFAGITLPNPASEALHRRFEFTRIGVFKEVGRKFDRYWDVAWFGKTLR